MAAQDAELKLKVSLDLAFFRTQLAGLGQAAAGYKIPVQVQFDKRSVQSELNKLGENIRRRDYRLTIQTNLDQEIKKARDLAKALSSVSAGGGGAIPRQGGTFRQELSGIGDINTLRSIYREAAKKGLLAFDEEVNASKSKIITALNQAAQDASQGFLNAFSKENSRVRKAAGDYGQVLLAGLKKTLRISSPSKEMFNIGDDAGKGFELGLLKALDIAEQSATRKMRGMLDRLARMALMMSGMSAADIGSQAGQFRGGRTLPGPSWAATVPPSQGGGGGGGRMLPPGPTFAALGGTAFGAQKYLPTALSDELKQILRGAAFAFVDSLKQQTRSVRVGLGASQQPLLAGGRIAGLLPAGVGRQASVYSTGKIGGETQAELFARREREARMRSALRGMDVLGATSREPSPYSYSYRSARPTSAIVPYVAGGALVPGGGVGGGGAGKGGGGGRGPGGFGMGEFGRALGSVNLPGANTVRELGTEFAFATKQVLLFGQAYKLLGFAQAFPGEVGNAVSQLQSFRNTLKSITGSATAAADANDFIAAAVEKYNIPLQSAREGFSKLFASMQPAGFNAGEIQNLFLGISKAAATFGLSADKVDRVNYAFAQMASKGQVMSEELKGQLGDVLPGAMGIFAEAAGFKGPDAIQRFSKALEDGAYKGSKMRELLRSVAIGMNKEFGPGAEGAAKTFQGAINRMQNSIKSLYESFEPAAISILNSAMLPFVDTLKAATNGINAYFQGQKAATPAAQNFANILKTLVPVISGISQNIATVLKQLMPIVNIFTALILQVGRFLALPLVGQLAATYAQVLLLTTAFKALAGSAIGAAIASIVRFIGQGVVYGQVMTGMRVATQQTTVAMFQFGTAVQTVMIKSIIGVALVAISAFIARIVELQSAMASISGQAKAMGDAVKASAKLGDVLGTKEGISNIKERVKTYEEMKDKIDNIAKTARGSTSFYAAIPSGFAKELMSLGLIIETSMKKVGSGYKVKFSDLKDASNMATQNIKEFNDQLKQGPANLALAAKQAQKLKQSTLISGGDIDDTKNKKQRYVSQLAKLYQEELSEKLLYIDQDASLSDREREIQKAAESFRLENLIAKAEYNQKISTEQTKNIANLSEYLDESKRLYEREKAQIQARYEGVVTKPLRDMLGEDRQSQIELQASIASLASGKKELSQVEKREMQIKQALLGLDDKQIEGMKPLIDLVLQQAKAVDVLTEAQKQANKAQEDKKRLEENLAGMRSRISTAGTGLTAGYYGSAAQTYETALQQPGATPEYAKQMAELETQAMKLETIFGGIQNAIGGIGDAFGSLMTEGIASMIQGTASAQEVFSAFLKAIGDALAQAASQMIATYIAIGIARIFAGMGGGGGGAASYGDGKVATNAFQTDSLGLGSSVSGDYFSGGSFFKPFADGGVVSGPTLGLIGEGRFNEAVVPLPDGKSIPVSLDAGGMASAAAKEVMGRYRPTGTAGIVAGGDAMSTAEAISVGTPINIAYDVTSINAMNFVTEDQFQRGITAAAAEGASRGERNTLRSLQRYSSVRNRLGMT